MQRLMQSMPSTDFIAKALGMEQSNIESLQQQQQGKSYLAQQLTQRGVQPATALMDTRSVVAQPGEPITTPPRQLATVGPSRTFWPCIRCIRSPHTPTTDTCMGAQPTLLGPMVATSMLPGDRRGNC